MDNVLACHCRGMTVDKNPLLYGAISFNEPSLSVCD